MRAADRGTFRLTGPGVALGLALALPCLPGCGRSGGPAAERPATPSPTVSVTTPVVRPVVDWDVFTGRLASPETVEIRARVSGYLQEVHFKEGAEVKEGDLLFTIDPRPYQAVVDRMVARVTSARSRSELTAKELENVAKLQGNGAISAEDYDRRAKAASDAEGLLRAAEAELREAQLDLEFTEIRSPIAGRVSDARVTKGNLVTGGDQEANVLTTVVSLDPIYCLIEVDERSVLKYRQLHREGKRVSAQFGQVAADMELAHETGYPHQGHIDFVDNQLDPATGTIRARAVFPNADKLMAPGFFARVRVPGSGEYQGHLIPDRAIADDQGTSFVWVVDAENTAHYRKVDTGPLLDGLRIVRAGLSAGDRVVVDGVMSVRNGQKVNPELLPEPVVAPAAEKAPAQS
ncbi:MAG: efflux RND transporter periplasmic adaptor subunit [Verrucomicrobiales bacterium]|nr:efflux RND transporter periplasmic adaptor subunit [Verrucomicrobiales bacterium]